MTSDFIMRALRLAETSRGRTSPNPMVGAVVVNEGRIVGEGFHPRAGEPHAEIFALRQAGEAARGSTLYVTLEPCCHFGRTPPCADALIAAGVSEVHIAMLDPNPLVAGGGVARLQQAGIATIVGEHEQEAQRLNEVYITWIAAGLPFVIAKFAMSLDGKIATPTGNSRWITGEVARQHVHHLRNQVDAIAVGVDTVIIDDPQLTTRIENEVVRHPVRVIVDSRGRIPLGSRVLDPSLPGRTIVATTDAMPQEIRRAIGLCKAEVLVLPELNGRVDLAALLATLGCNQITSLLVEGGATLLGDLFRRRLVDKVLAFVAPLIIGGKDAPPPVGGLGVNMISEALRLEFTGTEWFGPDLLVSGYPNSPERVNGAAIRSSLPIGPIQQL
jgi:diaminohydroxyphosphoribosylaminopyrimidine deaminase/5-amino-6-(5-phosphoribosylamino)uracil reductase